MLDAIIEFIGVFALCAILFAIPILTTVSFCMNWNVSISWLLVIACLVEFIFLVSIVCDRR